MGVQERKARERQRRCDEILTAAQSLFEERGFLKTTLQDVAQRAEISVGLIYRYFQSKEDIFAALALRGAERFDAELQAILREGRAARELDLKAFLLRIADHFFKFYSEYGEYFDYLLYSYKGFKQVQIHAHTITRLMSVTLSSLDNLKTFVQESHQFSATEEDEALGVVFLFWGLLLGFHRIFDRSGRGHIFAFDQNVFLQQAIEQLLKGLELATHPRISQRPSPLRRRKIQNRNQNPNPTTHA